MRSGHLVYLAKCRVEASSGDAAYFLCFATTQSALERSLESDIPWHCLNAREIDILDLFLIASYVLTFLTPVLNCREGDSVKNGAYCPVV